MLDAGWEEVRAAIVAVFNEEAHRLRNIDESLVWNAGGAWMPGMANLTCWLTMAHRGATDPHLNVSAQLAGQPTALYLSGDIGTFEGDVLAELTRGDDQPETLTEVIVELRLFLRDNSDLLESLAVS